MSRLATSVGGVAEDVYYLIPSINELNCFSFTLFCNLFLACNSFKILPTNFEKVSFSNHHWFQKKDNFFQQRIPHKIVGKLIPFDLGIFQKWGLSGALAGAHIKRLVTTCSAGGMSGGNGGKVKRELQG